MLLQVVQLPLFMQVAQVEGQAEQVHRSRLSRNFEWNSNRNRGIHILNIERFT